MRKRYLGALAAVLLLAAATTAGAASFILEEHFDNIGALVGWSSQNLSVPTGSTDWFQGNSGVFAAYDGAPDAYVAANFNATGNNGTIDLWAMTPVLPLTGAGHVRFFTRTDAGSPYPDRLEVWMSTSGASTSVGDFTTLLGSINPALLIGGYPEEWTDMAFLIPGVAPGTQGRIGFRYFVTDAGAFGNNSNYIGIDNLRVPEPTTLGLLGLGAVALGLRRRRQ